MARKKTKAKTAESVPVDAIKHKDSRTNIPTRELAAFAGDEERAPKSVLYPRDPSLDPQLVWKGKIGGIQSRSDPMIHVVQSSPKILERCLLMTTDPGDLVLDPTCGSGTTAYVAEQWGRRWITIDTSRIALALARTRLMAAKFPYYLLADSPEGRKKEAEILGTSAPDAGAPCQHDIRRGFVYKRVPHVTLKSIANNPDIHEGMRREQIDAAIRKHADTETLYDQPYEDKGVVRVSGPFTVESLSPHRMLPAQGGFAFDPHVSGQTEELKKEKRFGKLPILAVRMNPDLSMGDELLKKTGSGNLFMVFGEPDIVLDKEKDGRLVVELRGVDVYDPTTGELRSHSTDDIACWFLDTDYNDESFFVRHAYFCGADEPYEKLKKTLHAEIDEAEWSKLYSTRSLLFEAPKNGKVAVKVINHYGDEVLKVFVVANRQR